MNGDEGAVVVEEVVGETETVIAAAEDKTGAFSCLPATSLFLFTGLKKSSMFSTGAAVGALALVVCISFNFPTVTVILLFSAAA